MDHEQLAQRLERKIDAKFAHLEQKIDDALLDTRTNTTDIAWLKSFVKTSVGAYITLTFGVLASLFKIFIKD